MKYKLSLICMVLILVLSIGAVSATDIDNETVSNSDISISSDIDLSVENDGFDYVGDDIGTNDSDSSLLGVSEDEETLIGDGQFIRIEFRDAVDGVITFNKAMNWKGNELSFDSDEFKFNGFYYNRVYFNVYDENDNIITLDEMNSDFDLNGYPYDKEDFGDWGSPYDSYGEYDGYQYITMGDLGFLTGLEDIYGMEMYKDGTYEFILYNADRTFSQNVTVVLYGPRKVQADISIEENMIIDITTNDAPANFTIYVDDEKVANGTVNETGKASVSLEKIYGVHNIKVVQDGVDATGLTYEETIYVPEGLPGSFIDLNSTIANKNEVNLTYNFAADPAEQIIFKEGIKINNGLTINGNNHIINGSDLVRIFNIGNNANVVLKDLIIAGGFASGNGGAIYSSRGSLTVENCTFIENSATGRGGAIYSTDSNSKNNIVNSTFINNLASDGTGAIYTRIANITGCIFENNTATNDRPTIYYEGDGKGTISYNVFLDNTVQIRLRNNYKNVVEEYNWWATNNPKDRVRLDGTLSLPNKYLLLEAYNEGTDVYVGFIRDSNLNDIPNIEAFPIRQVIFEGDVDNTEVELTRGIATVTYTSPITNESNINATVDGYTINYTVSAGAIESVDVLFVENTTVGTNGTIVVYVSGNNGPVDGTLAVYLNDTRYEVPVVKNAAILTAGSELIGGIYDIYYEYLGSPNYAPTLKKEKSDSKFKVEKKDVEITYSINPDNGYITFLVSDPDMKVTGSLTCDLDNGWSRTWGSTSGTTNLDSSLSNGTHQINLTYNGDNYHNVKKLTDTFDVVKYIPPCYITQDGGKFTFNFTSELSYGGRVSVDFVGPNSFSQNYGNLQRDAIASIDVTKKLVNGSYNLTVHFTSSKYKYVSYDFNYTFDVLKHNVTSMTVSPEEPTKTVNTVIPVTVTITVEDGYPIPTGKVSFPTGGQASTANLDENGVAIINWANRADKLGPELKTITYEGDINYDPFSIEVTFVCTPAPLDIGLTNNGNNVTLTFNDKYGHDNNGVVHIYDYDEYLGNVTGNDGFPEFKINDLDSGVHYFTVVWQNNNGNNYTSSKSIVLRTPGTSQWVTTGFDNKNSGNPDYTRPIDDVYVLWSNDQSINITKYPNNVRVEYSGEITRIVEATYSPLIGSDGLIFLNDGYLVYVYDTDGNVLFSKAPGRKVPGIGLYNDSIVMAERTDDEIVIYDFITGQSYSGQFAWVSCSMFYPVEGPDGRVYIVSEYNNMENNGNWITVIAYSEEDWWSGNHNKFNWNDAYIDTEAIAPPVFDDEGNMWVATKGGIRAVNIYSGAKIFSDSKISTNARPAVSESNIVFYLSKETENSIYALTAEGYLWNTTVSGTVGTTLAIDNENGFVYSVNKEGKLYKYDINDGTETFVYDLGAKAKSIIVDGDSKVYVGDTNGYVTALDSEGNLLWTINLGAPIAGGLAMNNEGIIYAYTNDTLFALGYRDPISIEVTVPEGDYKAFDNVTVTATLNETVEGNVTFTLGDLIKVVPVNGTTAVWTTVLKGGNQTIFATFEGNNDYMSAEGNVTVSAGKLDVEFENVPEVLTFDPSKTNQLIVFFDIIYNGTNVTVGSIAGYDENNNKLSGTWRYITNNGWRATIRGIGAGYHNITIVYTGDSNYNDANTTFKLISLPTVTPSVKIDNDANEITVDVSVSGNNPTGKFTVTANDEIVANGTIENGIGSVTFDKLEPDSYEIKVIYEGDENIPANNGTTSIKIPRTSQWPNVGNDPQNSGNSIATRGDGVSIIWEAAINGDLRSSAIIDSFGNVYVNDGSKVYSFDSNGNLRWSGGVGTAGIAIFNDELIFDSQANNAMIILNATTGQNIGGNFYYASSVCPAIFMDGKIYVVTQYGYNTGGGWNGNHWIDIFSYDGPNDYGVGIGDGVFIVEVTGIGYGSSGVLAAPTFDKNGFVYVNTAKGFRIVNMETDTAVFSDTNIKALGRAVVDANNVAYILEQNTEGIFAINTEGIIWNVTVTGGIGSTLAVDNENGFLYSVNANGTLYKYSTTDGSEIKVYDLNSTGVSIILDADSNVYVSTANGNVTAFNSDGDLLWTINLGSKITGQLAMDNNGIIYAVADKKLYALGADANLNVEAENVTVFDEETITVTIAEGATGNVTIIVNGEENEVPIEDGTATLDLGELPAGDYTVTVYYNGDATYGPAFAETAFEISKVDAEITADVVASIEETTITVTLPEDATGRVFVTVNGKGYFAEAEDGQAVISIIGLESGNYTAEVTYEGDDNYNNASIEVDINVPEEPVIEPLDPELEVIVDDTAVVISLDEMASGYVVVTVGNESLYFEYEGDPIVVDLSDLEPGNYTVDVFYSGDEYFDSANATVEVPVPEEPVIEPLDPELDVTVNGTVVTVSLNENATGYVVVGIVDDMQMFFEYDGEPIDVDFDGLQPGDYTVEVFYSGDDVFAEANATATVVIPEVEPLDPELDVTVNGTVVTVSLNENATGYVVVGIVGDMDMFFEYDGEPIDVDFDGLQPGDYTVEVFYSGDDVFAEANATATVVIPEVEPLDPELEAFAEGSDVIITLNEDATGMVLVGLDDVVLFFPAVGEPIVVDLSFLLPGNYTVAVKYLGDEVFAPANATVTVTIPEDEKKDAGLKASVNGTELTVSLNKNATGYVLAGVEGGLLFYEYEGKDIVVDLSYLEAGNYTIIVLYSGDEAFYPGETSASVTIPEEPVIEPKDPNLKATAANATITVSVDKDATGNVLVDVDGQGYYAPIKDGQAVINAIGLDEGKYDAVVTYVGDDIFAPANATVSITVPKKEDPTPEPVDPKANISISEDGVDIALPEDATGYLLVDVDGTGYYTTVKDGKASLDLPELAPGNHSVTVTYTGDKKYDSANATKTVEVEGPVETIISENLTKVEKSPDRFEATFTDAQGNALANTDVKFVISGNTYTRTTDANGKAAMNINLPAGNYSVTIINPVTNETKVNTITVLPRLEGNDLTKYFKNASQFYVKVFDDNGNPVKAGEVVTFNINGVFYNRTTDDNGMAKLSINLIDGDYVITSEYKGCKIANNIKVLPILTAKDLTKQYGKSGAFEATLVDGQGKPYANQQVEFNINGVFYKRTTGSNGVAKLNINLQAGKYIVTSSYNGFNIANTVTVTA